MIRNDEIIGILSEKIRFAQTTGDKENMAAFCPFHKGGAERRPSLYVYVGPTRGSRHQTGSAFCHTCNEGWSFISLLKRLGINRRYADTVMEIIVEESSTRRPKTIYEQLDFSALTALPEVILGTFDYAPLGLLDAGFAKATLQHFDIGFDQTRKRVTYPIRDHQGNLVGISGRTVTGAFPRYKIYKDELTEVISGYEFKKGRVLWGLDKFYVTSMKFGLKAPVVVCEGFKAAMWVYQCGFTSVVALMGSHCTLTQKVLLGRVSNDIVLFLDNDEAGRNATGKISRDLSSLAEVKIASYPPSIPGCSPDDLTISEVSEAISNSTKPHNWRI